MDKGNFGLYKLINKPLKNKPQNRLFAVFFLLLAISLFNSDFQRLLSGEGSIAKAATNLPTPTLVGPAHNVWINSNPPFTANVSSLGGDVGEFNSIAVGTDGNPVISYFDRTNTSLKVAKCSNPACTGISTITTIDNNAQPFDTSIAIGREVPNGLPVISYQGGVNNTIMVAKCSNPACTLSTTNQIDLVPSTSAGRWNDITVGTDGNPVISYTEWSQFVSVAAPHKLKVAKCSSASCSGAKTITMVDSLSSGVSFTYTSIDLGTEATGLPIIIYHEDLLGQLRIAKCTNATCTAFTKTTLTPGGQAGRFNDIAVGSGNLPVMSYNIQNGATESLNVVKCTVANCTASGNAVVHSAVSNQFGHDTGIAIGTDTFPVISYDHLNNADLWVAKCINVSCTGVSTKTAVDTGGAVGSYNDIALGREATGLPVISYYDATNKDLKVAKCVNAACTGVSTITMVDAGSGSNNVQAVFHWVAVDPITTPPDTAGGWVVGSGNSSHTWAPALADGIYDWQAKALDANGDDSNFSGLWRVKKDTLNPTAVCGSLTYSDPNISVQLTPLDGVPASGGTPSGLASGDLQISDNGVWGPSQNLISGTYTQAATIGHTYSARYRVTDNAGNVSDSGSYIDCGVPVTASAPGWIRTSGGDVGSMGDTAGMSIDFDSSTPDPKAGNLVIADNLTNNFDSVKSWLVPSYSSSGNIQAGFSSAIFSELWQDYGKGKAVDWPSPGPPNNNGVIPSSKGVYAYPSAAAIDSGLTGPPDEVDFTYTGAAIGGANNPVVIFINGNLNLNSTLNLGNKKVIFVVKKNIVVAPSVPRVDGIFVTNGQFNSGTTITGRRLGDYPSIATGRCKNAGCAATTTPVIGYYDGTNGDLKVAKCGNADCTSGNTITTIDSAGDVGMYSSITIGTDGFPVMSYFDNTNGDLKVAKCGNADCTSGNTITTIDSTGVVGWNTSIAIGGDSLPVISYNDVTNSDLKVAHCGNAICNSGNTLTTVDTNGVGLETSITVNNVDGLPIISYMRLGGDDLWVAKCTDATCSSSTQTRIDSQGRVGYTSSIAIGNDTFPVIVYQRDLIPPEVKVAKCVNISCTTNGTAVNVIGTGGNTTIAIDSDGLPIVGFSYDNGVNNNEMKVAKCTNASCTTNTQITIDTAVITGTSQDKSIAIGQDSLPVIAYDQGTISTQDLKVAHCTNISCGFSTITTVEGQINFDCPGCQLVLNGSVISFGGFSLGRDLGLTNSTTPAEVFNYDPSYLYLFSQIDPTSGKSLLGEVRTLFLQLPP